MRTNAVRQPTPPILTHEGGPATPANPIQQLRRSLMCCLLWEDTFYEEGEEIAARLARLAVACDPDEVVKAGVEARTVHGIRHAPLWLAVALFEAKKPEAGYALLSQVVRRADEPAEVKAMWERKGRRTIPHAMRRALGVALERFDAYQLAKWDSARRKNRLHDVLNAIHPKTKDPEKAALWALAVKGQLPTPDTWEVAISAAGSDPEAKRAAWERLLRENRLPALALIRNLRNLQGAGVPTRMIVEALDKARTGRIWPFNFIAARQEAPDYAANLDQAMLRGMAEMPGLPGRTAILVDVSGSMVGHPVSAKSKMDRFEAAAGVAMVARNVCAHADIWAFGSAPQKLERPPSGFGLIDQLRRSAPFNSGTNIGMAVDTVARGPALDRILVITDEQSHDRVTRPPNVPKCWMMNVATYQHGVAQREGWDRIDGWSASAFRFLAAADGVRMDDAEDDTTD